MTTVRVQRILCDNPDCVIYVDELVREEPGDFELVRRPASGQVTSRRKVVK
jgi:hypothetical protein